MIIQAYGLCTHHPDHYRKSSCEGGSNPINGLDFENLRYAGVQENLLQNSSV